MGTTDRSMLESFSRARGPSGGLAPDATRRRLLAVTRAHFRAAPGRVDPLTGIGTHQAIAERLRNSLRGLWRKPPDLVVACIDLDGLRRIGALHGNLVDHETRRTLATRLLAFAFGHAGSVGVSGGEGFVCVLQSPADPDRATQLAASLFDALSAPCELPGLRLRVQPSIGVASHPRDGATSESLLMHADAAMRRARHYRLGFASYAGVLDAAFASPPCSRAEAGA